MCYALSLDPASDADLVGPMQRRASHAAHDAAPKSPAQQPGSLSLFSLPQEILDIIFDYAYPEVPGAVYINRSSWRYGEQTRQRKCRGTTDYEERPFPPEKVLDFLVSKRYFLLAARAFISNQQFDDGLSFADHYGWSGAEPLGIVADFVTTARLTQDDVGWIHTLPNLRSLKLEVDYTVFDILEGSLCMWRDVVTAESFARMAPQELFKCRGLRVSEAVAEDCDYAETEDEELMWEENVQRFGRYVQSLVTRPKEDLDRFSERASACRWPGWGGCGGRQLKHLRLYTGSKVCFGTSSICRPADDESSDGEVSDNGLEVEVSASIDYAVAHKQRNTILEQDGTMGGHYSGGVVHRPQPERGEQRSASS
ncbi:hypothetical protein LTR36_007069 [Oleoguttula mirabilis]|uniref:F-box domain-containing protein n=1 Tax=Oleoguttula mirabilis TaxID=1507867 RepID=A0AAV9JAY5_9PEZI|nr:hypothetical protein LTR36_007069 [Oleoguttula mirabilis]